VVTSVLVLLHWLQAVLLKTFQLHFHEILGMMGNNGEDFGVDVVKIWECFEIVCLNLALKCSYVPTGSCLM